MTKTVPFTLERRGRAIHGILEVPRTSAPAIVLCHGFKGFMEWGFFPHLATLLAERGFVTIRFNFASSGMAPGDELVTDLESFRTTTLSQDVDDLNVVLDALGHEFGTETVSPGPIGLFGHSRGGGTALLAAANKRHDVGALVTWAAVSRFNRLSHEENRVWKRNGEVPVVNSRTGQELSLAVNVLEDLERGREQLDPLVAAAKRSAPWLIVHGDEDPTVPAREAAELEAAAAGTVERLGVVDADHAFGCRHPFRGPTPSLITAMNATQRWFLRYLRPDGPAG